MPLERLRRMVRLGEGQGKNIETKEDPQYPLLRDILISTTFAPNRAINNGLKGISLGELGIEADLLLNKTAHDPLKREHAKLILSTVDRKLLIQECIVVGNSHQLEYSFSSSLLGMSNLNHPELLPKQLRQKKFIAAVLHTHSDVDISASPRDLQELFFSDSEPIAETAVFIATVRQKILIFRGAKTPQWDKKKAQDMIGEWQYQLYHRKLNAKRSDYGVSLEVAAFIREIASAYDLRFFSGINGNNYVTPQSA